MPVYRLLNHLDEFLQLGLNCEIYINAEFIDKHSRRDIELINSGFKKYELSKRIHGPFTDLNPGSTDTKIRGLSLDRFLAALDLCAGFGSDNILFHSHMEPIFYKRYFSEWFDNSLGIWEMVAGQAAKMGISVCIENSLDDDTSAVLAILKAFPDFGACFDIAHYNVFSPLGWKAELDSYPKGSIKEIHLSDNKGDDDSHLPLGEGSINFNEFFQQMDKRGENPIVTVESHSMQELLKDIVYIKKFMNEQ